MRGKLSILTDLESKYQKYCITGSFKLIKVNCEVLTDCVFNELMTTNMNIINYTQMIIHDYRRGFSGLISHTYLIERQARVFVDSSPLSYHRL